MLLISFSAKQTMIIPPFHESSLRLPLKMEGGIMGMVI